MFRATRGGVTRTLVSLNMMTILHRSLFFIFRVCLFVFFSFFFRVYVFVFLFCFFHFLKILFPNRPL